MVQFEKSDLILILLFIQNPLSLQPHDFICMSDSNQLQLHGRQQSLSLRYSGFQIRRVKNGERIIYDMEVVFNFQWLYQVVIFSGKMNMVVQLKI